MSFIVSRVAHAATQSSSRITALQWGGYHKLCSRKDANGNEVRLRYNLEGELSEVYNEHGEIHRLTYDIAGNLIGETTFDGRELRYRNNAGGRVVRAENGLHQYTDHTYWHAAGAYRGEAGVASNFSPCRSSAEAADVGADSAG